MMVFIHNQTALTFWYEPADKTGEMDIEDFRKPIDRTVYIKAQTTQSPARMGNDICTAFDSYSFVTNFRRFFGE